jgi:Na+/H+-dicarboxylate symporter
MMLGEIVRRLIEWCLTLTAWLSVVVICLAVPMFLLAIALTCLAEIGTRPVWALGTLWGAFLVSTLLVWWLCSMLTWKNGSNT